VAQIEFLPSKGGTLSSNPSTSKTTITVTKSNKQTTQGKQCCTDEDVSFGMAVICLSPLLSIFLFSARCSRGWPTEAVNPAPQASSCVQSMGSTCLRSRGAKGQGDPNRGSGDRLSLNPGFRAVSTSPKCSQSCPHTPGCSLHYFLWSPTPAHVLQIQVLSTGCYETHTEAGKNLNIHNKTIMLQMQK
jgi:hypothetical protein